MHNPELIRENETPTILLDFEIQTDHQISARRPDLVIVNNNNKKRICRIADFAIPADHGMKILKSEKRDKYLDLDKELKKTWNMNVTVLPIMFGALGTTLKTLVRRLEDLEKRGQVETIQTTALEGLAIIPRRVLET